MRKLSSVLLMLFFAGMQNLVADGHEGKLTVKINPYAEGKGKIYLSGDEYRKLDNPVTIEPDGSPIAWAESIFLPTTKELAVCRSI